MIPSTLSGYIGEQVTRGSFASALSFLSFLMIPVSTGFVEFNVLENWILKMRSWALGRTDFMQILLVESTSANSLWVFMGKVPDMLSSQPQSKNQMVECQQSWLTLALDITESYDRPHEVKLLKRIIRLYKK